MDSAHRNKGLGSWACSAAGPGPEPQQFLAAAESLGIPGELLILTLKTEEAGLQQQGGMVAADAG